MAPSHYDRSRSRSRSPYDSTRDSGHRFRDRASASRSAEPKVDDEERPSGGGHRHDRHHHRHHHRRRHHHHDEDKDDYDDSARRRHRSQSHSGDGGKMKSTHNPPVEVALPYGVRQLTKRDLSQFTPMFAMYLDIQKGLVLDELEEHEVKGRWKSFVARWNRGELAEGWYDPSTFERASKAARDNPLSEPSKRRDMAEREQASRSTRREENSARQSRSSYRSPRVSPSSSDLGGRMKDVALSQSGGQETSLRECGVESHDDVDNDDDDDQYGPAALPSGVVHSSTHRSGPTIPNTQDLQLQRESAYADRVSAREEAYKQRRTEIQSHKSEMRIIQDEIAPRAEPGTHERRMEKRRETAAANRDFAQTQRGGSPTEAAPESDLMGGGDDLEAVKKARERDQRKKNEREIRREELLRARAAEREERLQKYREKEDETMGWLKALAKQRFG